jgi:hypothetical protein
VCREALSHFRDCVGRGVSVRTGVGAVHERARSAPASRRAESFPCARVTGQVVDDVTGQPIQSFEIGMSNDDSGRSIMNATKAKFDRPDGRFD